MQEHVHSLSETFYYFSQLPRHWGGGGIRGGGGELLLWQHNTDRPQWKNFHWKVPQGISCYSVFLWMSRPEMMFLIMNNNPLNNVQVLAAILAYVRILFQTCCTA